MAVPISVGDAILLSRIAYNLGKAFTSGRKSAPAEFTEIQDLLYTLSGALKLLARDLPDHAVGKGQRSSEQGTEEINEEDALLSQMIVSCRTTLSYLNVLVEKYMDLDTNATHQSNERHWKDEIRKNWKKILWTKEGGDISKLKVTLSAHINGLNLAVGAINKKHGVAIRDDIGIVRSQLGDICAWFQQNLEGTQVSSVSKAPQQQRGTTNDGTLTFTVSIHKLPGKEHLRLHCPRASFRVGWLDSSDLYQRTTSIFECHCDQLPGRRSHLEELHITLSPSSLLVHLAQSSGRQWQMSAAAKILPNRSNYVYISDVEPSRISEFEEQASILAICQAKAYLERGRSSGLVSIQLYMTDEGIVSILDSKTEVHAEADEEESCRITFRVGEQRFVVAANSVYSILHYKSLSESIVRAMTDIARASSVIIHQPTAEFVFQRFRGRATFLDEMDTQYYISFHHDTHIELGENHRTVKLSAVLCVSEEKRADGSAQVEQVKSSSVEVEFNDVKGLSFPPHGP
ncbi:hypothetical protein K469DRAFT_175445 [Zopfia rhizophila CBS 207.26]|uniref:NACHT-NTPase and P-loop NTPases N-terminal domain-containing protein n=1 Tax=Zopfia rhizophila CBS 207.26 TaxID=1314779 RepID=A0A6A6DYZ5_9PEZI|nr:hypothetical protein K469DRAFT_175445 [Zopfia rhizophila CBS 207.26]